MNLSHNKLKLVILESIVQTIHKLYGEQEVASLYNSITDAPDFKMGHFAVACFQLAKNLKKAPNIVATEIASHIHEQKLPHYKEVKNAGPYVNFFISPELYGQAEIHEILNGNYFKRKLTESTPKTMVEYSQPNTHKEIHVGHMRNLCLGDALIKLFRYAGHTIVSSTFPGDVGTHVAKCLWFMKYHNQEQVPTTRKGAWLGKMYSTAHNKLEDERGTPKEEENRKQLTEILKQLESKQGEFYKLWQETREWSIELMQEVYKWAKVDFDVWYWESDVDADSLKLAKEYYQKGVFVESEGAIGSDLNPYKLGFCLLIKSDGNGLYATKDIELARRKFQDHKIEKSIYVVDKRQALHFQQVFKTLEIMGFENAKNCYHLQYDFVELPDGAMSSRKGNIVPIQELIDRMVNLIESEYLCKYKDIWTKEELDRVANQVAQGAIKYGMIRMDNNKKIVFDMKEWLKLDGESGPYIQYAHARINSLCEKLNYDPKISADWSVLVHDSELALMQKLTNFNETILFAVDHYKTAHVCAYLYDLAKLFNSFYAECSVQHAENEKIKVARLALCQAVAMILEKGLNILGIPAPKKM